MSFRILYVCTGNTCRSPLAEAITRRLFEERGRGEFEVASAGTFASEGSRASAGSQEVARAHGLDIEAFVSRRLNPEHVEEADLVLVMEPAHRSAVLGVSPQADTKTFLLGELAGEEAAEAGVPDPFGGDAASYRRVFLRIEELIRAGLDRIEELDRHKKAGSS